MQKAIYLTCVVRSDECVNAGYGAATFGARRHVAQNLWRGHVLNPTTQDTAKTPQVPIIKLGDVSQSKLTPDVTVDGSEIGNVSCLWPIEEGWDYR